MKEKQETNKADEKTVQEGKYPLEELVKAARAAFGISPHIMRAALVHGGKTEYTKNEARALAEKFAKKEVKN